MTDFERFASEHADGLARLAYLVCGDRGRAEDAAQTALERLWPRLHRLDDPLPYARRIAVNAARDSWRRFGRREVVTDWTPDGPASEPARTEDRDVLMRALATLSPRQREVVVLRHWVDLSEEQTAETLGISRGAVKSHGHRGLAQLRAVLAEAGFDVTSFEGTVS